MMRRKMQFESLEVRKLMTVDTGLDPVEAEIAQFDDSGQEAAATGGIFEVTVTIRDDDGGDSANRDALLVINQLGNVPTDPSIEVDQFRYTVSDNL